MITSVMAVSGAAAKIRIGTDCTSSSAGSGLKRPTFISGSSGLPPEVRVTPISLLASASSSA
ncbi:hypothetical protein D3C75_1252520 [compost metagenome]